MLRACHHRAILCLAVLASSATALAATPGETPEAASPAADSPAVVAGEINFELDVLPVLTAAGCNAGACHGKSRGQNGFALSLLGFDSDFDYQSLAGEARGRRVFPAAPEHSLLLRKPTAQAPHGGGKRFEVDSPPFRLLRQWIASGARIPAITRVGH